MEMGLCRKAWQCFYQNCESNPRRMECHIEVLLTTIVTRSKEPYSQQPRQNCTHSWNVLVHATSSVDCGWTCQVRLHRFTWGLTRRTWWQHQKQFSHLSKRKQSRWFPCCERKPVQEVCMILLTFRLKIIWQIVWQSHRWRQTIWSQQWKQLCYCRLMFIQTSGHSWSTRHSCLHGAEHSCT